MRLRVKLVNIRLRSFGTAISLIATVAIILGNVVLFNSPIVGAIMSIAYFLLGGYYVGKAFLGEEEEYFVRFVFGILLLVFSLIFVGVLVSVFYYLNLLGLGVILCAPLVLSVIYMKLPRRKLEKEEGPTEKADTSKYFSPLYIPFFALIAYCVYLLVTARTGWVSGTVWDVVSPSFLTAYFFAGLVLFGIILYSRTKVMSKVLLTMLYSLVSVMVFAVVLYPGSYGDPAVHLGWARMLYEYGNLRPGGAPAAQLGLWYMYWLVKGKGLALLTAVVAKMFIIDVYWIHTFIVPVLWGVSIPTITYKIARVTGMGQKIGVLAAFLTTFYSSFVQWGQRGTANSLGLIPFFISVYFSLWYLGLKRKNVIAGLLAVFAALTSALTHPFTGVIALIFVFLALTLKRYKSIKLKRPSWARLWMLGSALGGVLALFAVFALNNILYLNFAPPDVSARYAREEVIMFSFDKLMKTNIWNLIFEGFASSSFKDAVLSGVILFLGVIGLAYALKKTTKRTTYSNVLIWYMLLVFMICMVDFRIMEYAMIHVPFGPGRLLTLRDLIVIPFAALTVNSLVVILGGSSSVNLTRSLSGFKMLKAKLSAKRIFAWVLIGTSLSALAAQSVYGSYVWLRGLHPTALEVDAVKYIDEHTNGPYVVIGDPTTAMVGMCFVGIDNPAKRYVYAKGEYFRKPSVPTMVNYMQGAGADIGYFIVSTMRNSDFDKVVAEASRVFGLFKILTNEQGGKIYIFKYRVPPLPHTPDVMAFYWETPEGYYVQNDLFRLIFNPVDKYIDVKDPRWDVLYESIDLKKTMVGGMPLGNLTSVEYYNPSNDAWAEWDRLTEVPFAEVPALAEEFKFKLRFENESLTGVVARGNSSVRMWWEGSQAFTLSVDVGDFTRLYLPGLIGGVNSYDVNSREFGLFYTALTNDSLTNGIVLHPSNKSEVSAPSLTFDDIVKYCNYKASSAQSSYTLYVENTADKPQWAYLEVWLPDDVYGGTFPPISYSTDDGETWTSPITGVLSEPIETFGGTDVNWVLTVPRIFSERPKEWIFSKGGDGGFFILPLNFTDSGGAQNRFFFSIYLPAHDKVLVTLGIPTYYVRPLKITYEFRDSDDASYGMRNMEENLIKFYNLGSSEYVGGLSVASSPTSLAIVQDENGRINSVLISITSDPVFSFYTGSGVDTTVDTDGDGVPDNI